MEIKLHEKSNENKVKNSPKKVTEKYSNNIVLFKYHILNTNVHSCTFSLTGDLAGLDKWLSQL